MKICGIVAEYNPFHLGHAYQIAKTRQILGQDTAIVCVMSGNFVQRGECAIMTKQARAKAAIQGGADVVIELPPQFSVASAEKFAFGALSLLEGLGNITDLSFGCECEDISLIMEVAEILQEHETVVQTLEHMKTGISYAAARERALFARIREKSAILTTPNNILGIEYCKAIRAIKSKIVPHAILRSGALHDGYSECASIQSASYIRTLILAGKLDEAARFVPEASAAILAEEIAQNRAPAKMENGERALVLHLRRLSAEDFSNLSDCTEGLENRLALAACKGASFDEIIDIAKTKRYARSRLARMVLCAYLGISNCEPDCDYVNVLAFSERGRAVLRTAQGNIITKPADGRAFGSYKTAAARADMLAAFTPDFAAICSGYDYVQTPFYLKQTKS